ncbi:MAG: hypothetical protein ACE5HB_04580, partial [Terriglobia bacterium]
MNAGANSVSFPRSAVLVAAVLTAVGAGAFVLALLNGAAPRAWQIYLVNYLFWTSLAVGGVVLAAVWQLSSAIWGKAFQGLAVAGAGFLPVSLLLFLPLTLAGESLFPWIREPEPHLVTWMSAGFVFTRNGLALAVLFAVAVAFVYYRLRQSGAVPVAGGEYEQQEAGRRACVLAPVLCLVYVLVFSLLAFDLVQALDPHFYSTLFGGYFFFGGLYAALAWVAVLAAWLYRAGPARGALTPGFLHPMGKLLFGFALFHGMLYFSQYLPIWYGNLPHEIEFVIIRSREGFWPVVSAASMIFCLFLPFTILLSRAVKENPFTLAGVAVIVLVG